MYAIYNSKYYLMQNAIKQWIPTSELRDAFKFSDKTKAENTVANLPKQTRNLGYRVIEVDIPAAKSIDMDALVNSDLVNYDLGLAQIGTFIDLHDQLAARAAWCEYKLDEVDNKILDVLHAIEFNSCNARDGYKMYKLLHDLRIERRGYKDELLIYDVIKGGFSNADWRAVKSRVDDLKNRKYNPRYYKEMFE